MKKSVIALLLACALGGGSFAGTASAQSQSAKEKAAARDKESAKAWVELYPEIFSGIDNNVYPHPLTVSFGIVASF